MPGYSNLVDWRSLGERLVFIVVLAALTGVFLFAFLTLGLPDDRQSSFTLVSTAAAASGLVMGAVAAGLQRIRGKPWRLSLVLGVWFAGGMATSALLVRAGVNPDRHGGLGKLTFWLGFVCFSPVVLAGWLVWRARR
jgi:hypothetical protein